MQHTEAKILYTDQCNGSNPSGKTESESAISLKTNFVHIPYDSNNHVDVTEKSRTTGAFCYEGKPFSSQKYITWGADNKYPQFLYGLYNNCSTLQSIINGSADYTIGDGIVVNADIDTVTKNSDGDTYINVLERIALDLWLCGGSFVQIIPNRTGTIKERVWLDFRDCRLGDENNKDYIYYSKNWGKRSCKPIKYLKFNSSVYFADPAGLSDSDLELQKRLKTEPSIYYYKGRRSRDNYPVEDYRASVLSCLTQTEIKNYHWNTINNNFSISGVLSIMVGQGVPQNEKDDMEAKIIDKFAGADNGTKVMVALLPDSEHGVQFTPIAADSFDKKYEALAEDTKNDIFISLRALPVLFGMTVQTGFNTQEYLDAWELYNKTAIVPKQSALKEISDDLIGRKGSVIIKPFTLSYDTENDIEPYMKDSVNDIPEQLFNDLTTNERRRLIGFEDIPDEEADQSILADRIGVGGTQSLIDVITNPDLNNDQKRGTLMVLFGLTEDQVNEITGNG